LLQAASFIATVQDRQGLQVACPEEIAWRMGYITDEQLRALALPLNKSTYGQYLTDLLEQSFSGWSPEFKKEDQHG
jgi:glucose-1-phosphate thymidylyltransferase